MSRPPVGGVFILLVALVVVLLLPAMGPLRLCEDCVVYLSVGDAASGGEGFLYHGAPTRYPSGYPAVLASLNRLGVGYSWGYVAFNWLMLVGSLSVYFLLLRHCFAFPPFAAIAFCVLLTLS